MKYKHHCLFFKFIILLSGDVNLNPGPQNNVQQQNAWDNFSKRGLHLIHLNINSLLPKIEELRSIAKSTNAAVIGISESKLDKTIFNAEISIEGYDIIRKDRNRNGGGVACYVRNDICYNSKQVLQDDIENIFIDLLLPKTKPITVGIVYKPPHQTGFIEKITANFNSLNVADTEMYVLRDLNINLLQNSEYILENTKNITKNFPDITADAKKYIEFCQTFGLKQLIRSPTRITCNTSTLLDGVCLHVLNKLNTRLKFLYRKNELLSKPMRRLLCNALIQPHFDYACSAWYINLNKSFKTKLQVMQNKCIRFCLKLGKRTHTGAKEFNNLNWLPVEQRFHQCLCVNTFKYFNDICPLYLKGIFQPMERTHTNTRSSTLKLNQPLRKSNYGQRNISHLAPVKWNSLPENLKHLENIKYKLKTTILKHSTATKTYIHTKNKNSKNI